MHPGPPFMRSTIFLATMASTTASKGAITSGLERARKCISRSAVCAVLCKSLLPNLWIETKGSRLSLSLLSRHSGHIRRPYQSVNCSNLKYGGGARTRLLPPPPLFPSLHLTDQNDGRRGRSHANTKKVFAPRCAGGICPS